MSETQFATGTARTVDVLDATGATTGTVELPAHLFDVTANIPLIHQVVVAQLAAARQGTSKVKTRAEVSGGGTKPHRQKGTGRARQGSIRAPQYVGGGVVHGPSPRSYVQRTPKKMIAAALRGALSDRARDGRIHVVSDLVGSETPSTKAVLKALSASTTSNKVLVVLGRDEDAAWLSLRNVASAHALAVDQLNTYDVLVNDEIVFTSVALDAFIAGPSTGKSVKAVATESEVDERAHQDAVEATDAVVAPAVVEVDPPEAFDVEPSTSLTAPGDAVIVDPSEDDLVDLSEDDVVEPTEQELVEPTNDELAAPTVTVEVDPTESVVVESSDSAVAQPGDTVIVDPTEDDAVDVSDDDLVDSTDEEETK